MIGPFNTLDLVIALLVLLLGLKGLVSAFRQELLSLIAIIGAVFVASRGAPLLARWTGAHLFHLANPAMMDLAAFLLLLLTVWGAITLLGRLFGSDETAPSALSRLLGYLLAALKYFLIFAIITAALSHTRLVQEKFAGTIHHSRLYPLLAHTGAWLIHLPAPATPPASAKHSGSGTRVPSRPR